MPCLDMPLAELKEYKGINPCPADLDEYWERALNEMESVDSQVEFKEAAFKAKNSDCFDMYFTGVRNARIHCKHVRPKNFTGKLPAVLLFHGYSGRSDYFGDMLKWSGEGYAVFALDCRGQAGESEDTGGVQGNTLNGHIIRGLSDETPDNLLFRHIFLDTAQLAKIAHSMDFVDSDNIYATGGSQGGALTVACAALSPYIKKAAPIYPFLSDYKRVWEMDLAENAYVEIKRYFRDFDPTHAREDEIFTRLGYIDLHNLAPRITADLLMFTGLMDNICPPSTQFAIYNNLKCKKDMIIYPDFGHEGVPYSDERRMEFFR